MYTPDTKNDAIEMKERFSGAVTAARRKISIETGREYLNKKHGKKT